MTASVPHRPGAHSMLRFRSESNVQYDGYIIQSNRSLHLNKKKKPCASAIVRISKWDEKVYFSFTTMAQIISSLFYLFISFLFLLANGSHQI